MSSQQLVKIGEERRHPRTRVQGVCTPFGQVLDVSESGACVFRKGDDSIRVGDVLTLVIQQHDIDLSIRSEVIRVQRLGIRRAEIGIAFILPSAEQLAQLRRLAACAGSDFAPMSFLAA